MFGRKTLYPPSRRKVTNYARLYKIRVTLAHSPKTPQHFAESYLPNPLLFYTTNSPIFIQKYPNMNT